MCCGENERDAGICLEPSLEAGLTLRSQAQEVRPPWHRLARLGKSQEPGQRLSQHPHLLSLRLRSGPLETPSLASPPDRRLLLPSQENANCPGRPAEGQGGAGLTSGFHPSHLWEACAGPASSKSSRKGPGWSSVTLAVKTCFCKEGRMGRRGGELSHFRPVSRAGFPAMDLGPKAHNHTRVSTSFPLPSPGSGWPCGSLETRCLQTRKLKPPTCRVRLTA